MFATSLAEDGDLYMSIEVIRRPPRPAGPVLPQGELILESPPELSEAAGGTNLAMALMYLPMSIGPALFMFTAGASTVTYVLGGVYVVASIAMAGVFLGRGGGDRRRKIDAERREYLRYLGQVRRRVRRVAAAQREARYWLHPDPSTLWSIAAGSRLWERRPTDEDFADVRVAIGKQRLAVPLIAPDTKPVEDLEPLSAGALRRLLSAWASVSALPMAISLRAFNRVIITGDAEARSGLLRSMLAQLATFHAPDDLRIVVCADPVRLSDWDWLKWLPHGLHPTISDAAGPLRLAATDLSVLEVLLDDDLKERPRYRPADPPPPDLPHLVVVFDGGRVGADSDLMSGLQGVTVIELPTTENLADYASALGLHVTAEELAVEDGARRQPIGVPDRLTVDQVESLARQLAPLRISGMDTTVDPLITELGLPDLLGIGDVTALDVAAQWQPRPQRDRLRIPIGVTETGAPVELDIKESAQGGVGPHGLLVGATGSGKSELLRTLVIGLAVTHSSETLNFVLVDFKGGATFLGLDRLPHTSAVITNLAEELPLVDRMYDALHGELVRRQELLRAAGNISSQRDYERARERGAALDPLPSLFVIVDEFSELLSSKPEFAELFVMIGRLGRSLGVHLLLASQRLDEGRLRGLETHLSYRIGLRMFSGLESRTVLGAPDAYELPPTPGSGYLRLDTSTLIRFKAAYVSGPARTLGDPVPAAYVPHAVVPFRLTHAGTTQVAPLEPTDGTDQARPPARVLDIMVAQLATQGPPAHRVWLPPLGEATSLGALLQQATPGQLRVPVGIVDRPFEQRHDVLAADLSGAGGHGAIVGRPQSGKSTLLRTLLCGLALTHDSTDVQFYGLDFGGGTLAGLARLPHVGGVATRREPAVVRRTVAELASLLERRERLMAERGFDAFDAYRAAPRINADDDPYGHVFLVIDGVQAFRGEFESLEPAIVDLAARGLNYGIHLIVTANRWIEIRPALRDLLGTRFELRLGEPFESEMHRRAAANVPERQPGRGITSNGLHFAAALPRVDGLASTVDLAEGVRHLVDGLAATGRPAPAVRLLPSTVPHSQLPPPSADSVPIGIDESELAPVVLDFATDSHLVVLGDTQSGKSNLLRLIANAVMQAHSPERARLIAIDYRRALFETVQGDHLIGYAASRTAAAPIVTDVVAALRERLPGRDIPPAQLRAGQWWRGAHLYLVVDDYDLVESAAGNPLHPLVELLPQARDIGLHLIVARASGGAARAFYEPLLQRLKEMGSPTLVLSGSRDEGVAVADVKFQPLPPGRGTLVSRRSGTRLIQTATLGPVA
jgi:S-DNA-T family DNA segregation ATPase FtsK/SpoIIIE